MEINKRLRDHGLDPDQLCESWDKIRPFAVANDPTDLVLLARVIEDSQDDLLRNQPVLGAPRWLVEDLVPLGGHCYAVLMHDGHIQNCAIVQYRDGAVTLIDECAGGDR